MKRSSLYMFFVAAAAAFILSSCGRAGDKFQGREYMPDMGHSIAYEANHLIYYPFNRWGTEEEYRKFADTRKPVTGTIAFNAKKAEGTAQSLTYPIYHFPNTDEGRAQATAQLLDNPVRPNNDEELKLVLDKGKELYEIYCASCHGKAGDGNGKLYSAGAGPYPAAPANYLTDQFIDATDGRFYHAIVHGIRLMGPHADKLSHDERWMVIHYIRSLQVKSKKGEYTLATALARKGKTAEEAPKDDAKDADKKDADSKKDKPETKKTDKKKGGK